MNKLVDLKNAPAALTGWFAPLLAKWPSQFAGDKPTQAMLAAVTLLDGFKNGSARPGIELLHLAMTLRPQGCTVQQFCTAGSCGPANNRRRLVKAGLLSVTVTGKPYAFACTVTAKGWQLISSNYAGFKAVAAERNAVKRSDNVIARKGSGAKAAANIADAAMAKAAKAAAASKAKGVKARQLARARKAATPAPTPPTPPTPPASQGDGSTPQAGA